MQVKAKELGYYGMKRRRPGEVFSIDSEKDFSKKWMESLEKPKAEVEVKEDHDQAPILKKKK